MSLARACLFLLPLLLAACASVPRGLDSPVPVARASAIAHVAEAGDQNALVDLVALLESDDAVTRMLAHRALRDITGEDLGYNFADAESTRRAAADRWRQWLAARALSQPVAGDGATLTAERSSSVGAPRESALARDKTGP